MTTQENPFSGIESPFFWPVGMALAMEKESVGIAEKNLKFFREVVQTEIVRPKPEWATANKIVCDLHTHTLRDFSITPRADEVPTLVLPPYAGHTSVIADFHQGQSLIETLLNNGLTKVYATDWRSADMAMKDYDIDNYLAELHVAVGEIGGRANLIGLCQGGWMASLYAARFPQQVTALVCAGSPLDTQAGNGGIRELADDLPMHFYENLVAAGGGLLKGAFMLEGFKSMHPEEHMVKKYVTLYENIDDPGFVQRNENFERWYEYTLNLPGRWYLQAVQQLFKENRFAKGEFVALGRTVKPQGITCPLYLLAGSRDDITPAPQVFNATQFFGTPPEKTVQTLAEGGHIGLFMGTRALKENWPAIAAWLAERKD
ncbi:MAG: alpha/beta fold hydrolase [Alphaproteobacteria bacterium]|nr:alpha/beta fold hydrolase [Alphaproteobacteria bacterium]